jgi:hypothetical protein
VTGPAGEDGEGMVSEEMVEQCRGVLSAGSGVLLPSWILRRALTAVAPDIAAQAKRECAEELRTVVTGTSYNYGELDWSVDGGAINNLVAKWSGHAPTDGEEAE